MSSNCTKGSSFDLQKSIKGPGFPWSRFKGEYHVPSYNFLGPGTNLYERLNENLQPKSDSIPIDSVDTTALGHDIRYTNADKRDDPATTSDDQKILDEKHEADRIMIAELEKIDPSCFRERFAKWIATNALKLKLKFGLAINPLTGKPMNPIYSPALSKLLVDIGLLENKKAYNKNPDQYPSDYLENMQNSADNIKKILSGGTINYEQEAANLVNKYLAEYDKDSKEYDAHIAEEERKKREVPFMEKVAEIIEKPFRWLFEWTVEQIPGAKDYVSFDGIQNAIMGEPKWKTREKASILDEAIKQLDNQIDEMHKQKKMGYNNPELESIYTKVRALRDQRRQLKNVLGYGVSPNPQVPYALWKEAQETRAKEQHARIVRKFPRRSVWINGLDDTWSADLIFFENRDKGFNSALTIIDNFSKFGWAVPLKSKTNDELISAFEKVFKTSGRKPAKLWVDKGSEFYGKKILSFMKNVHGIKVYSTESELKAVIVERWNRTLKERVYRRFTELNDNKKWVDILAEEVDNYNNTIHSTIRMTPTDASKKENETIVKENLDKKRKKYINKPPKFEVGDKVRIYEYKYTFDKGYKKRYTDEVFEIKTIHDTVPYTYSIVDKDGEVIKTKDGGDAKFYKNEMIRTAFDFEV